MKVLHVIPSVAKRYGGPSTAIFPMCRALNEVRCEVKLCTTNADGLEVLPVKTSQWVEYDRVETIFFSSAAGEFKYSREMAAWLNDHVSDFDIVHIHAVFNYSSLSAARACRKHAVPYIVRPLGTLDPWSMSQKRVKKKLFWRTFGKSMLENAAAVHYTTEAEQRAVETTLNTNHGAVVPLGVDLPPSHGSSSSLITPHLRTPYLLFLSRLHPKKGVEVLIEAFTSVMGEERFKDWKLLIAGEGDEEYVRSLSALTSRCDMDDSIEFLGWLDGEAKAAALCDASLFVLPSHQENFGMSVVEAMSCGVPVMVSPQVNLAAAIEKTGAGWVVRADKTRMKTALEGIIEAPEERQRRGEIARRLSSELSWENAATLLKRLYVRALVTN